MVSMTRGRPVVAGTGGATAPRAASADGDVDEDGAHATCPLGPGPAHPVTGERLGPVRRRVPRDRVEPPAVGSSESRRARPTMAS